MDVQKMQKIRDRCFLNDIEKSIKNIIGVSIRHSYKSSDVHEKNIKILNEIYKNDFPVFLTKENGDQNYRYIEYLYEYLKITSDFYIWLIPYFNGSNWWIELEISNLYNFVNLYCPSNHPINLTVFDISNNLLFDIEIGESAYEYRIIRL